MKHTLRCSNPITPAYTKDLRSRIYFSLSLLCFQELLGLGLDIPGMISRGTMERDDDEPSILMSASSTPQNNTPSGAGAKLRTTLSVRPNLENNRPHGDSQHEFDAISEGSELMNESVVSSITDR